MLRERYCSGEKPPDARQGTDEAHSRQRDLESLVPGPMTSLNPVLTIGYQIAEVLMTHENMTKKDAMDKAVELLRAVRIPSPELRIKEYPIRCQAA